MSATQSNIQHSRAERFDALFDGLKRAFGQLRMPKKPKAEASGKVRGISTTETAPLTLEHWRRHLDGGPGLGIVPVRDDGTCLFAAIDLDEYPLDPMRLLPTVTSLGLPLTPIRSKSGGLHWFVFFAEPVDAKLVRRKLDEWATALGHAGAEVFPRQDALDNLQKAGSWLNMPYRAGEYSLQYAHKPNGSTFTVDEFLDHAEASRITAAQLEAVTVPEELLSEMDFDPAMPGKSKPRQFWLKLLEGVPAHGDGDIKGRDQAMTIVVGKLFSDRRIPLANIRPMLEEFNRELCKPPKPEAVSRIYGSIKKAATPVEGRAASAPLIPIREYLKWVGRDYIRRDDKIVAGAQENIQRALEELNVTVLHDTFSDRLLIEGPDDAARRHLDDVEVTEQWLLIDQRCRFRPTKEFFFDVITHEARLNAFHPVRDYLDSLKWDGTPRLERWLTTYACAEDTEYTRAVGRLTLIAAVRRIRQPGVKFDEMLILESDQGFDKSTALEALAIHSDWFTDSLPLNADDKKVIETLSGRWIVEAAELKGMRRGDIEHLKAFLSRRIDRARMSYGRLVAEAPRQCVIIGTTNRERYLRDNTGNRRFWPVKVRGFDVAALRRDRDQIWAEAAAAEARGASIRLDPTLYSVAGEEQEERRIEDPFVGMLAAALGDMNGKILVEDAWLIVNVPEGMRTQDHNGRLGDAMRELGWRHSQRRVGGGNRAYVYARGTEEECLSWISVSRDPDTRQLSVSLISPDMQQKIDEEAEEMERQRKIPF